jgi:hypothetical protein
VVVDTTTAAADGGPTIDWGLPVELPPQVLVDMYPTAAVQPVVVRNGAVLYAPGQLDLGYSSRLASPAQRRALRAIYDSCALGCGTPFSQCDIHHITPWDPPTRGPTDLINLAPLCTVQHQEVHQHGWRLSLAPDRTLTVELPDGTTRTFRPNRHERGP